MADHQDELIPSLVEDLTFRHMVSKMSWIDLKDLSVVSTFWRQATRSRKVHDARILQKATERLIVVKHWTDECVKPVASLYSMKDKTFHRLPPIPPRLGAMSRFSQFCTSDGNLYVSKTGCNCNCSACNNLQTGPTISNFPCTANQDANRTIMFDVAGHGQWKEHHDNQVFTGHGLTRPGNEEVCDEEECRMFCASKMDRKIFLKGKCACYFPSSWYAYESNRVYRGLPLRTVEWDSEKLALDKMTEISFMADKKQYLVTRFGSEHHFLCRPAWTAVSPTLVHSISRQIEPAMGTIDGQGSYPIEVDPLYIIQANDELVAIAQWTNELGDGYCMIQSRGFASARLHISWERVPHSSSFFNKDTTFAMCPIQL